MKEITVKLYSFEELTPGIQDKVLDKMRADSWDTFDSETLTENFEEILREDFGIEGVKVYWSLQHCQGDGVCFIGRPDVDVLLAKHEELRKILESFPRLDEFEPSLFVDIKHRGHYYHSNSMDISIDVENVSWQEHPFTCDSLKQKVDFFLKELFKEACAKMVKVGYEEIEYKASDEYLRERYADTGEIYMENGKVFML